VKRGLDANVLIYAQMPVFPEHEIVRKFLLAQLAFPDMTLVVTPSIKGIGGTSLGFGR
jgi:hypothetical protein